MDLFEFYGNTLNEAIRKLCNHLYLSGETQQVDRILFEFARRYWECNEGAKDMFKSIASERSIGAASVGTNISFREGIALEGLLIRKHLTEKDGLRAKNRRWVKVWCVMSVDEERGVELTMFKVDPGHGDAE
ncbi:hypothetical protein HDV05_002215, partial [Chytridiales sp. JEL 0842]